MLAKTMAVMILGLLLAGVTCQVAAVDTSRAVIDLQKYDTDKPEAEIELDDLEQTYDGWPKAVTARTYPYGLKVNVTYSDKYGYVEYDSPPTDAGIYAVTAVVDDDEDYQGEVTDWLVIDKADPGVLWYPKYEITYGTPLSDDQFRAIANTWGTFAFNPAKGAILPAGYHTLYGTFTPDDQDNYLVTGLTQEIKVLRAPLTARADDQVKVQGAANPPLTISYAGFVLGDTRSSITEPVATTTATTNSPPGSYPITVTGGNAANYEITGQGGTLTIIAKTQPTVTWPAPAAITYGTVLSAAQLNATASVPGTFSYYPVAGTLPGAGAQILGVTFTPIDTVNYASVTTTQSLTVNKAVLVATAADHSRDYGAVIPPRLINYAGFVNGEDKSAITEPTITTPATRASSAGTYPILLYGGSAANYTVRLQSGGTLTVNKAPLTARADDQIKAQGRANPALTVSYSGLVNGDTSDAITGLVAASTADAGSPVGTYPITLSGGASANYVLTRVDGTLTVAQQEYQGSYFGSLARGGNWALYVRRDHTAIYLAYLPEWQSAIAIELRIDVDGSFAIEGSLPTGISMLSGRINGDGSVTGLLAGPDEMFTGSCDVGTGRKPTIYTAKALGTYSGTTYAIVGGSGRVLVVATGDVADSAEGLVDGSGHFTATAVAGATLTLALDTSGQSAAINWTRAGAAHTIASAGLADSITPIARVVNLSIRSGAGVGDRTLIGGLVVGGAGSKTLLARGVGPGIAPLGVTNALADPRLRLLTSEGAEIDTNDDWAGDELAGAFATLGAFPLAPASKDAAIYRTLGPGVYSFHVYPGDTADGVALAELYDADTTATGAEVVNISARTQVGLDENILILGFVIRGNTPKTLLIRGVGPTLIPLGVTDGLVDPQLYLYQGNTVLTTNDNWGGTTALKNAAATVGAGALVSDSSKDAALLVTLAPGVYSAQVSGVGRTTGVGLVEIFLLP